MKPKALVAFAMALTITTAAGASETAKVVWQTEGSITFAVADGEQVWMIEAGGDLGNPTAALVKVGASSATRVITFKGRAFSPAPDKDSIYVVVDHDVQRVSKRPPHASTTIVKNEVWPVGLAVDADAIYVANQATEGLEGGPPDGKPGSIGRIRKSGSAVERLARRNSRDIVLDAKNVYFSCDTAVCAVSKSGGSVRTLVADTGGLPSLAIDGEWLSFTRSGGVSRVNTRTGKIEPLPGGVDIPLFVAAANGSTYVAANSAYTSPGNLKPGAILRLRPGKAPEQLWSGAYLLGNMVLAGDAIYFTIAPSDALEGAKVLRLQLPAVPAP